MGGRVRTRRTKRTRRSRKGGNPMAANVNSAISRGVADQVKKADIGNKLKKGLWNATVGSVPLVGKHLKAEGGGKKKRKSKKTRRNRRR